MIKAKDCIDKTDRKLLRKTCFRTLSLSASFTYDKMQGLGFLRAMIPFINHYNKTDEKRIEAYKRQWTTFNTTPTVGTYISGISAAMEKKVAQDESFNTDTIEATKSSLMAPVASIGDFLCWGTLRVIALAVGIALALQGSILGVLLHLIIFNIPTTLVRYYGSIIGFTEGTSFMTKLADSSIMNFVNKAGSILSLMMVGALTFTICKINIPFTFVFDRAQTTIPAFLDSIFPGLLGLGLVFGCFGLLKKGVKNVWILASMLAISLIGAFFGIF